MEHGRRNDRSVGLRGHERDVAIKVLHADLGETVGVERASSFRKVLALHAPMERSEPTATNLRMLQPRHARQIVLAALAITSACGTPPAEKAPAAKAPAENPPAPAAEKGAVAIIGTGTLAGALGPALGAQGYRVIYGSRDPGRDAVRALVQRSGPNASAVSQPEAASQAPVVAWSGSTCRTSSTSWFRCSPRRGPPCSSPATIQKRERRWPTSCSTLASIPGMRGRCVSRDCSTRSIRWQTSPGSSGARRAISL